ncbi:site-specific tyrosine recombinase, phage integrase family (INT_Rci_Hp1_C domain) [Campylobacter blaseri]|uniref:Integrase n=1 Tax=Campylobacter blaseri TaxID=2042961 RepID=A0A2P8QYV3_9BACT|nr:site-specific integrase [Campylobacter blaseri]PSM51438.1 integrase [Campylobacter blaseri]PSM52887.1 integrase [Campylobacter blaseri]QKF86558.1 site-specific tyrosine recombinase, phage integrase family (INT_Rci_Hp1_C domain) [Campylobacter blaseri]
MSKNLKNYNSTFGVNKYPGVWINNLKNGDVVYYIRININNKKANIKIGSKSEGVNVTYAYNKKKEFDAKQRNGELPDSISKKIAHKNSKNSLTFDQIAQNFFNFKLEQNPNNEKNIKEQKRDYEIYHKDKFGKMYTIDITSEMIDEHYKALTKIISPKTKRKLSQSRLNSIIGIIRTIFNYAIRTNKINHISPYKIETKKPDNKRERFLEIVEIDLLRKEVAKKGDFALELFIELALCTGARLEGVLNIKKKDVSLSTKSVIIKDFKTSSKYTGFLSKKALNMILKIYTDISANDFLINKPKATIQNVIQPLLNKLFNKDLEIYDTANRVVIHTLRHTFASHLAIAGTPILTIKKLMNHSDINHTLRYAKLMPDSGKEIVENLYE